MSAANLSFGLLGKFLDVVIGAGFVRVQNSKYELTERGREFLDDYRHFEERYLRAQQSLESLNCEREQLTQLCKGFKRLDCVKSIILRMRSNR